MIAEGVETLEHLAMLQALDCEFAQGYYFGRPCPAREAERFLSTNFGEKARAAA